MKRYLLILLILPFIFYPTKVLAAPGWAQYINNFPTQLSIRDCSGQACNTSVALTEYSFNLSDQGDTFIYYGNSSNMSFSANGSGGMIIYGVTSGLNPSTLYSSTLYVCTNQMDIGTNYFNYEFYIGDSQQSVAQRNNHGYDRFLFTGTSLGEAPLVRYISGGSPLVETFSHCYSRTILFNPTGNYRFIGMSMKANTSSSGKFFVLGYDLEALGSVNNLTSQDITNAVQNSGLATANSVTRVQTSVNEVKQEISGMQEQQEITNDKLDDLNDNITSEDEPDIDLELDESSNTPISDLILFPITLLNKLINTIGDSTCSPYTLPFFYDTTITFPCFQLSNYLGTSITNSIDLFICLFMCYNLAMLFISIFEDITSLRDTYDSLYEPKHADTGYKPKHGKE